MAPDVGRWGIVHGVEGVVPTMTTTTTVPLITLNDGSQIPQLGFGVFQIEPAETKDATLSAFEAGYRHIDTAEMYGNEEGVGQAVAASGIDRSEIFITSKLNNGFHERDAALAAFDRTMDLLGLEYLDLFLIHWPLPAVGNFVDTWKAMEEMKATGRVRSIGVSNFQPHHLQRLFDETGTVPSVNQIEVHPYLTQDDVRAFNTEHGIATESWSPIAQGKVLGDPQPGGRELRPVRFRVGCRGCRRHHGPQPRRAHRAEPRRIQLDPVGGEPDRSL